MMWTNTETPFGTTPFQVEVDYGVPVDARCSETAPNSGIFVREWTKAHVEMNCNDYTAKLDMK